MADTLGAMRPAPLQPRVVVYLVVDLLLPFLNPARRRAMHDIIADTLVVRAD